MKHPSEEDLSRYLSDASTADDRRTVEAHLEVCTECRAVVDADLQIIEGLADHASWDSADELLAQQGDDLYAGLARLVEQEDADAQRDLAPLIGVPLRFLQADVSRDLKFRTGGAVRALCTAANKLVTSQPTHALDLADAAVAIASAMADVAYPYRLVFGLRGLAWKERANALRYLGQHGEALAACQRAEESYRRQNTNVWEIAVVRYVRATVYRSAEKYQEAITLARECATVFDTYGDGVRSRSARLVEAASLHCLRQFRHAKAIYDRVLREAEADGDVPLTAAAAVNLGDCETSVGEFDLAQQRLELAERLFRQLGFATEQLRVRWNFARLDTARGHHAAAVSGFASTARAFIALGLFLDAALVDLDRVAVLLEEGQSADVRSVCSELVTLFEEAQMFTSALMALAYLKDAADRDSITPLHVAHVRQFLEKWREQPHRIFAPLPGDDSTIF